MKIITSLRSFSRFKNSTQVVTTSIQKQNEIFNAELAKRHNDIGRIEKINIVYNGLPEPCTLAMNKFISTPFNVAQHIAEWLVNQSALAMVNSQTLWDMHRPLEDNCEISFCSFTDDDPYHLNKTFWRSCSFVMGAMIQDAFNSDVTVTLHSFPSPQVTSGSFTYDVALSLNDWIPTQDELRSLSASMVKLSQLALPIERLQVEESTAREIFSDNQFKLQQIPDIAANSNGKLVLYRVGSHIDISKGPMISNTSFIGRCTIAAVHKIKKGDDLLYRFQGVALPRGLMLNHFAYRILEERARKLNMKISSGFPYQKFEEVV